MKRRFKFYAAFIMALLITSVLGAVPVLADTGIMPKKVMIKKSSMTVYQGKEFEIKARVTPVEADDDYLRWEIVSGEKYVRFDDDDRDDDEIELKAIKPGKAVVRCYITGKDKEKYGDVITVTVKKRKENYGLSKIGKTTKVVELYDDFDLEVKKGYSIQKKQLKWKIENPKIVGFEDRDRRGDEVEFVAKKIGTTKVTCICTNKNAKVKKITYTIKVVRDDDDDYDYDDYDYDYDDDDYDDDDYDD